MKNKIYYLGMIVCGLLMIASTFKNRSWAGAQVLLLISISSICLVFLPSAFISCYKSGGRKKKALYMAAFFALFFTFSSTLFKIMHWPLSNYLFFIGMLLLVLLFLPVYLYFFNKETDEPLKNFLYIIFFLVCLSGIGAIMAVRPSNNILIDAIKVNNAIDLDDYYHLKKELVKNYSNKAVSSDLEEKTITLLRTINDLKTDLIIKSSKQNSKVIKGNHKILLWKIWNLENQDVARTSAFRGKVDQLMQKIEEFQHFLISIPAIKDCGSVDFINELLPVEFRNYRNVLDSHSYYYDTRLIMTILQLTEIENSIRLAESEAISILNSQQVM
jgi:hypothetical protein